MKSESHQYQSTTFYFRNIGILCYSRNNIPTSNGPNHIRNHSNVLSSNILGSNDLEAMRDINDIMPKIPDMKWGAVTNMYPTNAKIKMMNEIFPPNGRWHTVLEEQNQVHIDGKTIRRRTAKSMT